jgi:hypothetical protein
VIKSAVFFGTACRDEAAPPDRLLQTARTGCSKIFADRTKCGASSLPAGRFAFEHDFQNSS